MTRLIDADAIKYTMLYKENWLKGTGVEKQGVWKEDIDAMPTVDAVPVIRCRDCKFLRFTGTVWKCQNRLVMMLCEPNDYCSRGERKDNETD